jgi:hypothetical protein
MGRTKTTHPQHQNPTYYIESPPLGHCPISTTTTTTTTTEPTTMDDFRQTLVDENEVVDLNVLRNEILSTSSRTTKTSPSSSSSSFRVHNRFETWPKLLGVHEELLRQQLEEYSDDTKTTTTNNNSKKNENEEGNDNDDDDGELCHRRRRRLHHPTSSDIGRVKMLVQDRCCWSPLFQYDRRDCSSSSNNNANKEDGKVDHDSSVSLVSAVMGNDVEEEDVKHDDDDPEMKNGSQQGLQQYKQSNYDASMSNLSSSFVIEGVIETTDYDSYTSSASFDDFRPTHMTNVHTDSIIETTVDDPPPRNNWDTNHSTVLDGDAEGRMLLWDDDELQLESMTMKDDPQESPTKTVTTSTSSSFSSKRGFCRPRSKYERQIIRRLMLHFLRMHYHSHQPRGKGINYIDDTDNNDENKDSRDLLLFNGLENVVAVVWMAMIGSTSSSSKTFFTHGHHQHRTAMTYLVLHQLVSYPWGCHIPWNISQSVLEDKFIRFVTTVRNELGRPLYDWIMANHNRSGWTNVIIESWIPTWFAQDIPNIDLLLRLWDVLIISSSDFVLYVDHTKRGCHF